MQNFSLCHAHLHSVEKICQEPGKEAGWLPWKAFGYVMWGFRLLPVTNFPELVSLAVAVSYLQH